METVIQSVMPNPQPVAGQHLFTVDVEEYFQVVALEPVVSRSQWDSMASRVEASVDRVLELLTRHGTLATFFTLGWLGKRYPHIVRRIVGVGHEIASHGWWHRRVTNLTPSEFRDEVRDTKALLEDVSGQAVYGYRAPSFSIVPGVEWAFDVLLEEGYRYDSSLFPIRRPDYGYPLADTVPHLIARPSGTLLELPLATTEWLGLRLPAAGGGYLRHLPYEVTARAFRDYGERGVSGTFYVHPWELDPGQPRLGGLSWQTRLRHYGGLGRTLPRLERLLREFRFTSVASRFGVRSSLETDQPWADFLPA
jgi:polysaccharide deacetylase family protein (PEP-CTERM system associated)